MIAQISSLLTTLIALVLTGEEVRSWLRRGRASSFYWALAFLLTALAAGVQYLSYRQGWSVGTYRLYLIAAALIPGYMGLGTAYLLFRPAGARLWLACMGALTLGMLYAGLTASLSIRGVAAGEAAAGAHLPGSIALFFGLLGGIGSLLLIGGALYSFWRLRQTGTLLIALGGIVFAAGGTLAGTGHPEVFYLSEIIGILLIFAGVNSHRPVRGG